MGTSSCRDRNGGAEDTPSDRRLPPMALTLAEANQVVHGALARAKELNIRISVAVCDAGGRLVAFNRMDGAIWAGAYGSQGKAIASAAFARPSGELAERAGSPIVQGIAAAEGGHMIPSQGAVPIIRNGVVEGACGVGGGTAQQDEDCAPPGPRLRGGRQAEAGAEPEAPALRPGRRVLRALEPVELLLPREVTDHPRDGIDRVEAPRRFPGGHRPEPADPFAPGEPELRHERMRRHRSSVFFMTARPCSIMPAMVPALASGSRSAIQMTRLRPSPSATTCIDALWWVSRGEPTTAHASRRAASSTSTISSRATRPLPKVTTLAPSSRRVSTTNPGTRRSCTAPTSRTAAPTLSGGLSVRVSLRVDAIPTPRGLPPSPPNPRPP